MKIEDIKPGKTYFHTIAIEHGRKKRGVDNTRPRQTSKIYVLEVDMVKKLVLGSIGGAPAKWIDNNKFCRWTERHPDTMPPQINTCRCGAMDTVKLKQEKRAFTYQGKKAKGNWWVYRCSECKQKFTTTQSDNISLNDFKKENETTKPGLHIGASKEAKGIGR